LTIAFALALPVFAHQETPSPRALFDSGKHQEAAQAVLSHADSAPPQELYLAAQSLIRVERRDEARDVYGRLGGGNEEDPWTFIGRSGAAALEGNTEAALNAAQRAVELGPDHFEAHYQLGLVRSLRNDFNGASAAFERATEIDGGHAYAHYYAGIAYAKVRRMDRAARHLRSFVSLAPQAPERPQVDAMLRTMRF
jgi:tetratricopeptide (TPR) repeat protein